MTDIGEWTGRVGGIWAREWQRTDRSFGPLTDRLLDHPAFDDFNFALEIGCGAGEIICRLGEAHPNARVVGLDVSPDLLEVAEWRAQALGSVTCVNTDAALWEPPSGDGVDVFVSRHGVMFFPAPVAAFTHFARIAAPGATLRFSCFRSRQENAWAVKLASVLPAPPEPGDPHAPGPFAFGDREHVAAILARSGWEDAQFEAFDYPMLAGEGDDAVEEALTYFLRIGPAARAVAQLDEDGKAQTRERLRSMLAEHLVDAKVALPAAAWIVTARAPD